MDQGVEVLVNEFEVGLSLGFFTVHSRRRICYGLLIGIEHSSVLFVGNWRIPVIAALLHCFTF